MRTAIQYSVNIPAVKMLERIGVETGYNFGRDLGLSLVPADKGLSLALGGLTDGVSPLEIASAYGSFANEGVWIEPHLITRITDQHGNTLIDMKPKRKPLCRGNSIPCNRYAADCCYFRNRNESPNQRS